MASVNVALEEQVIDERSNEKSYTLRVTNHGPEAIRIQSVIPRLPDAVELIEVRDTSLVGIRTKHADLCAELNAILSRQIQIQSEQLRQTYVAVMVAAARAIIRQVPWPFSDALKGILKKSEDDVKSLTFVIEGVEDAERGKTQFMTNKDIDELIVKLYDAKVEQLKRLEAKLPSDSGNQGLAAVAPDSFFSMGYTIEFPRHLFSPRQYSVTIDVGYTCEESTQPVIGLASQTVVITPNPLVLSVVSALAGCLGWVVRFSYPMLSGKATAANATASGAGMQLASAAILAFVLFNIYEYLDLGKKMRMGVSWRSAIAIGAACGLFAERVIEAMSVIVGGK